MRFTAICRQALRPNCPVWIHNLGSSSSLSFSPKQSVIPVGTFTQNHLPEFEKAFNTEPDKFEPKQIIDRPDDFNEDKRFLPIAQMYFKNHIHKCPIFAALAEVEDKSHFFHIYDLRNPPPTGRIPSVEDILGTVEINNGSIVPHSYEPNGMYRPVSSYGAMMVSKEMAQGLREALEKEN